MLRNMELEGCLKGDIQRTGRNCFGCSGWRAIAYANSLTFHSRCCLKTISESDEVERGLRGGVSIELSYLNTKKFKYTACSFDTRLTLPCLHIVDLVLSLEEGAKFKQIWRQLGLFPYHCGPASQFP